MWGIVVTNAGHCCVVADANDVSVAHANDVSAGSMRKHEKLAGSANDECSQDQSLGKQTSGVTLALIKGF